MLAWVGTAVDQFKYLISFNMKKIVFLLIIYTNVSLSVLAQDCDLATLLKQPGHWLPTRINSGSDVTAADLARQKVIVNSIAQPIQQKYSPKGVDIEPRSGNLGPNRIADHIPSGNFYTVDWTFVKHDCPYNKALIDKKLSGAYGIDVIRLHINDFAFRFDDPFFVPEQPNEENPQTDVLTFVDGMPVKEGAAWNWNTVGRTGTDENFWLIAQDDKLPFSYISKKEFAERLKVYYQKKIKEAEANYTTNMKSAEEAYENVKKFNAAEATKYKEQSAIQFKQQLEIDKNQYTKNITVVDNILKTDKALNEPAIIDNNKSYFEFEGFVEASHIYARYAIKPNLAYFNPKLPKSSPQFMVLYYNIEADPVFKAAREEFFKALDFANLKAMLGK